MKYLETSLRKVTITCGGIPYSDKVQICQNVFTSISNPHRCHISSISNCSDVSVVSSSVGVDAKQLSLLPDMIIYTCLKNNQIRIYVVALGVRSYTNINRLQKNSVVALGKKPKTSPKEKEVVKPDQLSR